MHTWAWARLRARAQAQLGPAAHLAPGHEPPLGQAARKALQRAAEHVQRQLHAPALLLDLRAAAWRRGGALAPSHTLPGRPAARHKRGPPPLPNGQTNCTCNLRRRSTSISTPCQCMSASIPLSQGSTHQGGQPARPDTAGHDEAGGAAPHIVPSAHAAKGHRHVQAQEQRGPAAGARRGGSTGRACGGC